MRIAATGFVGKQAGSVASANAVILRSLLSRGHSIRFFTKPSFVDPREIGLTPDEAMNLKVVDCTNWRTDALRQKAERVPLLNRIAGWADVTTYNRGLVAQMCSARRTDKFDVSLWLGDNVRGRVPGVPSVGYLQGPPATDARSIHRHESLITRLAGRAFYLKLRAYAVWRMGLGYPDLSQNDYMIVGSQWSRSDLIDGQGYAPNRVHALPYPIDLHHQFRPSDRPRSTQGPLKLLWLGRFVPRKRLDLFLDGMELAIRDGCDVEAIVIGSSGFVPNYEQLLTEFPYPERLEHVPSLPRVEVPGVLANVDVMAQPSDDENFGSSVAESLACGVPAIVGATNGTGDYICDRSIRLVDDSPETMAAAIVVMADAKKRGELHDPAPSRVVAERYFNPESVVDQLEAVFQRAVRDA